MSMQKWQIKRKSSIGQQLVEVWNNPIQKWERERKYAQCSFEADVNEARQMRLNLEQSCRIPVPIKWVRLYEII